MKKVFIPIAGGITVLQATGYLQDAKYILGGISRAMRCGVTGVCILSTYLSVFSG
jgi:hypothetical protein